MTLPAAVTIDEDAGAQTLAGFATEFTPGGGADEAPQVISDFVVSNDNAALFSVQPDIDTGGTLTFSPAAASSGSARRAHAGRTSRFGTQVAF